MTHRLGTRLQLLWPSEALVPQLVRSVPKLIVRVQRDESWADFYDAMLTLRIETQWAAMNTPESPIVP